MFHLLIFDDTPYTLYTIISFNGRYTPFAMALALLTAVRVPGVLLLSLLSLVGFEEILRFTQDDSWRVSLVVVVVVVCLSFLSKRLETEATKRSRGLGSDKF